MIKNGLLNAKDKEKIEKQIKIGEIIS